MNFTSTIINWYKVNKRDLPWRDINNAYFIWLSEIILQQTRVEQGRSYFQKFVNHYPTVFALANASEDEVLKLWQGLGYYTRARNLHATAKLIVKNFGGNFPETKEQLTNLKGIGDYTAAAIASFAFNKPEPVVDGNVFRLLSRFFGISTPIDSSTGKKGFTELANELMDKKNPALFNQAIMEFGALQCKPVNPYCLQCPLQDACVAFINKEVVQFPVKSKALKPKPRYFNYLVIHYKDAIYLNKRTEKDIWTNLFEFPLIETKKRCTEKQLVASSEWENLLGRQKTEDRRRKESKEYKHQLSHQTIYAKFFEVEVKKELHYNKERSFLKIPIASLERYAVPRLIDRYWKERKT